MREGRKNLLLGVFLIVWATPAFAALNLLERYPTRLSSGDTAPERARAWEIAAADIFHLSSFSFSVADSLRIESGEADLGVGHCVDGAVWAVVIPRTKAELKSPQAGEPEALNHVWLRFHPRELSTLFPPERVESNGNVGLKFQINSIASSKIHSSWQAGGKALIPEPKDLTLDVDTATGRRRFYMIDTVAHSAQYVAAFENRPVKLPATISSDLAEKAFDQLWEAFDKDYAMFVLRPGVDWAQLRDQYRPRAVASKSTLEFAHTCAEMLRPLRDLHVWLTVAGSQVPVFNRERVANANPNAFHHILGDLNRAGPIQWAITSNHVGFIALYGWSGSGLSQQFDTVLEKMRDTNTIGLVFDVRLNGGGSEDLAREVAGRFLDQEFLYAYSQFRNGSSHTNLTEKFDRRVKPRGPWRYERPVVLLIGQKCMSSNESFVAMMSGARQVTILGDHTCGSSGNPRIVQLPLDMTVSVPRWIDYLPDGTPLDEKGFVPAQKFVPQPGAFEGNRDDLLAAALERLVNL